MSSPHPAPSEPSLPAGADQQPECRFLCLAENGSRPETLPPIETSRETIITRIRGQEQQYRQMGPALSMPH